MYVSIYHRIPNNYYYKTNEKKNRNIEIWPNNFDFLIEPNRFKILKFLVQCEFQSHYGKYNKPPMLVRAT
jgi:hypothetical protein